MAIGPTNDLEALADEGSLGPTQAALGQTAQNQRDDSQREERLRRGEPDYDSGYTEHYRALSPLAVVAGVLGLFSLTAFLSDVMLIVPVLGLIFGIVAWRRIAELPDELTGLTPAKIGVALSTVCLVGGVAWHTYVYMTEVPEGYQRVSFEDLRADPKVPNQLIPPSAVDLVGKDIFVKGYIFAGGRQSEGIRKFVLVRDRGDCCFGGNPPITDRIQVSVADSRGVNFVQGVPVKVAGKFRIQPEGAIEGEGGVYYHLDGAALR